VNLTIIQLLTISCSSSLSVGLMTQLVVRGIIQEIWMIWFLTNQRLE